MNQPSCPHASIRDGDSMEAHHESMRSPRIRPEPTVPGESIRPIARKKQTLLAERRQLRRSLHGATRRTRHRFLLIEPESGPRRPSRRRPIPGPFAPLDRHRGGRSIGTGRRRPGAHFRAHRRSDTVAGPIVTTRTTGSGRSRKLAMECHEVPIRGCGRSIRVGSSALRAASPRRGQGQGERLSFCERIGLKIANSRFKNPKRLAHRM